MKRAAAAAGLVLLLGCEATTASQTQAIVAGMPDPGDPAVVAIVARRDRCTDSTPPVLCSGTLIAPRVVLTAAHCLLPGAGRGTLEVYVGGVRVGDPSGRFIAVDDAVRHPDFDDATHAHDLGLVRLAEAAAVEPVPLPTLPLDASATGAPARVVGFGVTGVGMVADGSRREGAMTVGTIASLTFEAMAAPSNSCGGDSGGPVFVTLGGTASLLGVTVSGDTQCQIRAINGRVDVALDAFIRPYLAAVAAATDGDGPIPLDMLCTAPCETASDCPAAMACMQDTHGTGHCEVAGRMLGDLVGSCTSDAECPSGACARITPDACGCQQSCAARPPGDGCAATGDSAPGSSLLVLAMLVIGRRRRR